MTPPQTKECLSSYFEFMDSDSNWPVLSLINSRNSFPSFEINLKANIQEVDIGRLKELDNSQLIRLFLNTKDDTVWKEFYSRFNSYIVSYIRKALLPYKHKLILEEDFQALHKDLVQDTYLKLLSNNYASLLNFKNKNFYAYLFKISSSVVKEYFRKLNAEKRHRKNISLQSFDPDLFHLLASPSHINHQDLFFLKCDLQDLLKKISFYSKNKRNIKIFILFTLWGMTTKEIIQIFDSSLTVDTIETVIKNTRKLLKLSKSSMSSNSSNSSNSRSPC